MKNLNKKIPVYAIRLPAILISALVCIGLFAHGPHREEGAHEHGIVGLDIAIEGATADIDLEGPAVNFYGFEHAAISKEDKARQKAGLDKIRNNLSTLIQFDPSRGCTFRVQKLEWVLEKEESANKNEKEGQHSVVQGEFKVSCKRTLKGSKVQFGFSRIFKEFNLKRVKVQLLADDKQKGFEIQDDKGSVQL